MELSKSKSCEKLRNSASSSLSNEIITKANSGHDRSRIITTNKPSKTNNTMSFENQQINNNNNNNNDKSHHKRLSYSKSLKIMQTNSNLINVSVSSSVETNSSSPTCPKLDIQKSNSSIGSSNLLHIPTKTSSRDLSLKTNVNNNNNNNNEEPSWKELAMKKQSAW